jgi:predicted transcriptional regulator
MAAPWTHLGPRTNRTGDTGREIRYSATMTKITELTKAASDLPAEQLDALIHLAKTMRSAPFLDRAPPDAIAALEQGLAEIAAGKAVEGSKVFERLDAKLRAHGL